MTNFNYDLGGATKIAHMLLGLMLHKTTRMDIHSYNKAWNDYVKMMW